jgi:rhodanese-related sulfurtransferase
MWPFRRARQASAATPPTIDVREAWSRARRGARLVDVRSAREFAQSHPKGARSLPPARIKAGEVGLAPADEILVICLSGHRSPRQARKLADLGYANVSNVGGGLLAWKRAGLPVKGARR